MKWTLTCLLLCFCATTIAQNTTTPKKGKTSTYAPFAWYKQQIDKEEEKDKLQQVGKNLNELIAALEQSPGATSKPKIAVGDKMPVYTTPETEVAPMPVTPVDTTITQYLKIYPAKED